MAEIRVRWLCKVILLSLSSLFIYSCNSDEGQQRDVKGQEVVFEFDANQILNTRAGDQDVECSTSRNTLFMAEISLITPKGRSLKSGRVSISEGKLKSDPFFLEIGSYIVDNVTLFDGMIQRVAYSGVRKGGEFANYIPPHPDEGNSYLMGEQTFEVTVYTKPSISTYLLCASGEEASSFGMPKFEINSVDVACFDIFFNVCNPSANNEHFVGSGVITLYDKIGEERVAIISDTFGEGDIATLCFADNLTIADQEESYYVEVVFDNSFLKESQRVHGELLSVTQLKSFKSDDGGWNSEMNCVHKVYSPK
ncbi:MAG: hypothetical protein ACRC6R_08240 [Bacteroidales bacterium]